MERWRGGTLSTVQLCTSIGAAATGTALGVLTWAGAPQRVLAWLKTPPIIALFAAGLAARPSTPSQRLTTVALGLSAVGDALLTRPHQTSDDATSVAGMATFAAAYLTLTGAFWRGRPRGGEALTTAALAAHAATLSAVLWPHLPPPMRAPVLAFGGCVLAMGATAVATVQRGWFSEPVARRAAAAAVLLTLSDTLVALHMFHPRFRPTPVVTELAVRWTYLAGWSLLLLVVQEPAAGQRRIVGGP